MSFQCAICEEYLAANPPSYKSPEECANGDCPPEESSEGPEDLLGRVVVTDCGHIFHEACLHAWFRENMMMKTCPSCRCVCSGTENMKRVFPSVAFEDQIQARAKAEATASISKDYDMLKQSHANLTESLDQLNQQNQNLETELNWRRVNSKILTEALEESKARVAELEKEIENLKNSESVKVDQTVLESNPTGIKRTASAASLDEPETNQNYDGIGNCNVM